MKNTDGMRLTLTRTACKVAARKGWTAEQIQECFDHPSKVVESFDAKGQYRIADANMVIVGAPVSSDEFRGFTMFPAKKKENNR